MPVYEDSFADFNFRGNWDFVSFTDSELEEIANVDRKAGRHWSPLAQASPILEELSDQLRGAAVEATPAEPAPTEVPEMAKPTLAAKPILVERSPEAAEEGAPAPGTA